MTGALIDRYAGPGYVGTVDAILEVAEAQNPSIWKASAMSRAEMLIWGSIGNDLFEARHLTAYLENLVPVRCVEETDLRLNSFHAALNKLRELLHEGEVFAGFRDKRGREHTIVSRYWGSDAAPHFLLSGLAEIDDENGISDVKYIIVGKIHLDNYANSLHREDSLKRSRRGALPKYDWNSICADLEEEVDKKGGLPTLTGKKGWRIAADGVRLLEDVIERRDRGEDPGIASLKREWTKFAGRYLDHKGSR